MNISIKASKLELTPAIKEYIEKKIGSLDKFLKKFEENGEVKVAIEIARTTNHHHQGDIYKAEANLNIKKIILRAEHVDQDMRAAIDNVKDKLKLEIQKYKEKNEVNKKISAIKKLAK